MRVLLSTIGSRGDVQPLVALAVRLRECGHGVSVCAPPDFRGWVEGLGLAFVPIGPELRAPRPAVDLRAAVAGTVATQFETLGEAGKKCDVIVACNQIQVAARSVAELLGARYVFADYSPVAIPSPHHAPPPLPGRPPAEPGVANEALWRVEAGLRDSVWLGVLNGHRVAAGLPEVGDVMRHVLGEGPMLAADPGLAPWVTPADVGVRQTGAWLLPDARPLSAEVEEFLAAGAAPVYFGFGSMTSPRASGDVMLAAARGVGRRAIVLRGWGGVSPLDGSADCLVVDEVNVRALFPRVAAVVHHGGAGTTTAAALAGSPQVVVPHHFDQAYFASRVDTLGIGVAHPAGEVTEATLTTALGGAMAADAVARAFGPSVRLDGTDAAIACLG